MGADKELNREEIATTFSVWLEFTSRTMRMCLERIFAFRLFILGEHLTEQSSIFKVYLNGVPNPFEWLEAVERVFAHDKYEAIPLQRGNDVMHIIEVF